MNGKQMIKGAAIVAATLLCASMSRVYAAATVSLNADDMVLRLAQYGSVASR